VRIETANPEEIMRTSRVKPVVQKRMITTVGTYILAAVLIAASLSFFLWTRVAVVTKGYRMLELTAVHDLLLKENGELKIQYETVVTPRNLERMGGKMGLKYPGQSQMVPVREDVEKGK
jgi:kynureninase